MKRKNVILLCLCCCTICIVCATICIVSMLQHKDSSEEFSIIGRWNVDSFVMDGIIIDAQNIPAKYDEYGLKHYTDGFYVFNSNGTVISGTLENQIEGEYTLENTVYGLRIAAYWPEYTDTTFLFVEDDLIIGNTSYMTIRYRKE